MGADGGGGPSGLPGGQGDRPGGVRPLRFAFVDLIFKPDQPGTSGLSDVNWNMARELARLGDDVHIFAPYTVEPEPFPGVTVHPFPVPPIGYRNILGHVLIALRARARIARLPGVDVIHAPEYLSTGVIAPLTRTPVVLTTPGNIYERIATGSNPWDPVTTAVLKAAARSSARSCLMVAAISTDMRRWWRAAGTAEDRVALIPHGVDTALFRPIPGAAADLGLPADRTHLLYVGQLAAAKNLELLLNAVALRCRAENGAARPLQLHLIGAGVLERQLRAVAAGLGLDEGRVVFHGQMPFADLPRWYAAADAFVLPSKSEPLGRVMLEAMASGTLFIGTKASGPLDHVRDGENGFLVGLDDAPALADRLRFVQEEPERAREIGARGRAHVERHLTWPVVVRRFRDAVAERLERRRGVRVAPPQTEEASR